MSRVQDGQESVEDDDIVGRSKTSITGINVKKVKETIHDNGRIREAAGEIGVS